MADETLDTLLDKLRPATLAEIAERCGLSLRALADLRAGRVSDPRRATVIALSLALKCSTVRVRRALNASCAAAS